MVWWGLGRRPQAASLFDTKGPWGRLSTGHSSPTEYIDDRQQDDRAPQRQQQRRQAEIALVNRGDAKDRAQEVPRYKRPYDTHHNIHHQALSAIGSHDIACDPAYERPCDKPYDEVHFVLLRCKCFEITGDMYLGYFLPDGASLGDQVM